MTIGGRDLHIRGRPGVVFVRDTSEVGEGSLDRTDQRAFDFLFRRFTLEHSRQIEQQQAQQSTQISFLA